MDHKVLDLVAMLLLPFPMGIYKVTDTKLALALWLRVTLQKRNAALKA